MTLHLGVVCIADGGRVVDPGLGLQAGLLLLGPSRLRSEAGALRRQRLGRLEGEGLGERGRRFVRRRWRHRRARRTTSEKMFLALVVLPDVSRRMRMMEGIKEGLEDV